MPKRACCSFEAVFFCSADRDRSLNGEMHTQGQEQLPHQAGGRQKASGLCQLLRGGFNVALQRRGGLG